MYRSYRSLARDYDCSIDTIRRMTNRMRSYIDIRYPRETFVRMGREWRVDEVAFKDWASWWPAITLGYTVPEFTGDKGNEGNVFKDKKSIFSQRRNA